MTRKEQKERVGRFIDTIETNLDFIKCWAWGDSCGCRKNGRLREKSFNASVRGHVATIQKVTGDLLDRLEFEE